MAQASGHTKLINGALNHCDQCTRRRAGSLAIRGACGAFMGLGCLARLDRARAYQRQLKRMFDAQPARQHIVLLPRSQQIAAAQLPVRTQTQLERRFYLLGESTELLALLDIQSQLSWLGESASLDSDPSHPQLSRRSEVEIVGYARRSPLALLAALSTTKPSSTTPKVTQLTLHDYPRQWNLAPVLPGLARTISLDELLDIAKSTLRVNCIDSHSPTIATEGYDATRQLLVDGTPAPQQASGIRIVEPTSHSATVWCEPRVGYCPIWAICRPSNSLTILTSRCANVGSHCAADGTAGLAYAAPA